LSVAFQEMTMQVFTAISTLIVVGITLQGCNMLDMLSHHGGAQVACQPLIEKKYEKYYTELVEDNTTEEAECVKKNLKKIWAWDSFHCGEWIVNQTELADAENETLMKEKAEEWMGTTFVDRLESNTTLQEMVKDCDSKIATEFPHLENKFGVLGADIIDQDEVPMQSNVHPYVVAAGVGMLLAAFAGIIHRRASGASAAEVDDSELLE